MKSIARCVAAFGLLLSFAIPHAHAANGPRARWTDAEAKSYMDRQPYPVGGNFLPADAINQLEMWQADTYDAPEIDKEFGWAEVAGMTTMRVFLHDLLWQQDQAGFTKRVDNFLGIAAKHHIKPVLVLFDSCWEPLPKLGRQHPPIPGVHNSGWVQSPGLAARSDPAQQPRLEAYVKGIVGAFASDKRILAWDLWNEPDNKGGDQESALPAKVTQMDEMLPKVFAWARSVGPVQPLSSGVWMHDHWDDEASWSPTERIQLTESDIITFHDYSWPEKFEQRITQLEKLHRPLLCTEYMARGAGSTFDNSLPIAAKHNVGAINWGLVQGKSQTFYPWDSWQVPYVMREPTVWFHDVFYTDGRPYRPHEVELIKQISDEKNANKRASN